MNHIKSLYNTIVNAIAAKLSAVFSWLNSEMKPVTTKLKSGEKLTKNNWVRLICMIGLCVITFLTLVYTVAILALVLTSALSIFLAAWFAELVAAIAIIFFELDIIGRVFEVEVEVEVAVA
jgi:mannitol-specific phosphotransferase system IIBC component